MRPVLCSLVLCANCAVTNVEGQHSLRRLFVFLSKDKLSLESLVPHIRSFLLFDLHLTLYPNKIFLKTIASGVDFLGWVHFPDHRVLRIVTKNRMLKRIQEHPTDETIQSYRGLLSHGNTNRLRSILQNLET